MTRTDKAAEVFRALVECCIDCFKPKNGDDCFASPLPDGTHIETMCDTCWQKRDNAYREKRGLKI